MSGENLSLRFPTRSFTNQAVQLQIEILDLGSRRIVPSMWRKNKGSDSFVVKHMQEQAGFLLHCSLAHLKVVFMRKPDFSTYVEMKISLCICAAPLSFAV